MASNTSSVLTRQSSSKPLISGCFTSCSKIRGLKTKLVSLTVERDAIGVFPLDDQKKDGIRVPLKRVVGSQLVHFQKNVTYRRTTSIKQLRRATSFTDDSGQKLPGEPEGRKVGAKQNLLAKQASFSSATNFNIDEEELDELEEEEDEDSSSAQGRAAAVSTKHAAFFSICVTVSTNVVVDGATVKQLDTVDYVFRVDDLPTKAENEAKATKFRDVIRGLTARKIRRLPAGCRIDPDKKILLMVNPKSGPGKSLKILKGTILPIFQKAGVPYDLLVTKRANHARDLIASEDLSRWSAIVILSGDGLLYEAYQGLLMRPDWANYLKTLPMGIIAGGSGNGLARSLAHETSTHYVDNNILGATLSVTHGRLKPMDMLAVSAPSGKRYLAFLSVGWGFLADCDIESNKLRALGDVRFSIWAAVRLANFRTYKGKLSFKRAEANEADRPASLTASADSGLAEEATVMQPAPLGDWKDRSYEDVSGHPLHFPDTLTAPPFSEPVPSDWETIEDDFVLIYAVNMAYIASDLNLAPESKLADGVMQLMVIRKGISKAQMLAALTALEKGKMGESEGVDLFPVSAFRLEPAVKKGHIVIDGEEIDYEPLQVEIMPSLVNVIE